MSNHTGTPKPPSGASARHESLVFARLRSDQDRIADAITRFAGSMSFVYVHIGWFSV